MRRAAPANWSNLPNRTVAFLHGLGHEPTLQPDGVASAKPSKAARRLAPGRLQLSANMRHERGRPAGGLRLTIIFSQTSLTMPIFPSPEKGWGGFV